VYSILRRNRLKNSIGRRSDFGPVEPSFYCGTSGESELFAKSVVLENAINRVSELSCGVSDDDLPFGLKSKALTSDRG
jgi:hypothetical protein